MAINRFGHFSGVLTTSVSEQAQPAELITGTNAGAEEAARKLLILISGQRDQRVLVYAAIDEASQRPNKATTQLDGAGRRRP